jgi:hypothetical protein
MLTEVLRQLLLHLLTMPLSERFDRMLPLGVAFDMEQALRTSGLRHGGVS